MSVGRTALALSVRGRPGRRATELSRILPLLLLFLLFFDLPIVAIFGWSFRDPNVGIHAPELREFTSTFTAHLADRRIAIAVTVCALLGYPLAL
jgi:ABC-type spermidine/putrescine transport system permease subunit II